MKKLLVKQLLVIELFIFLGTFLIVTNPCNPGNAYLSSHDYKCGNVIQKVSLGAGVASEAIIYKNKIYIGLSGSTSSGTGTGSSSSSSGSGTTSLAYRMG